MNNWFPKRRSSQIRCMKGVDPGDHAIIVGNDLAHVCLLELLANCGRRDLPVLLGEASAALVQGEEHGGASDQNAPAHTTASRCLYSNSAMRKSVSSSISQASSRGLSNSMGLATIRLFRCAKLFAEKKTGREACRERGCKYE